MSDQSDRIPTPDLRIVLVESLHPHEEHDSQRSQPLIERLRTETIMINPPLVTPMHGREDQYVILDGANRVHSFSALGYPHILVQIVTYESGFIELNNWQHVVADWSSDQFIQQLRQIPEITLNAQANHPEAICLLHFRDRDSLLAVCAKAETLRERNRLLCLIVHAYQRHARLHRTPLVDPDEIYPMFPDAEAIALFPLYTPDEIIAASRDHAYLPPGISRHIVQGRAINVNYPLDALRDRTTPINQKNADLLAWTQHKLANRQVRYYAEATYQFDE
jgi:hypothetical protein